MTDLDFQYFSEVARILNFSKAAENLFITQSALSRCIQKLENELGVKLLERDKHEVRITAAGEVLLRNYNTVQKANSMLKQSVLNAEKLETREIIRIGIMNGHLIPEKVKEKMKAFTLNSIPVSMELISISFGELFHQLDEKMIDVALAYEFPFKDYSEYEKSVIDEEEFRIIVTEGHPLLDCRTDEERYKMLGSMTMLCSGKAHQKNLFPYLLEQCSKQGFQPKDVQYYPTYQDLANALIMEKGFVVFNETERYSGINSIGMDKADKLKFSAFCLKDDAPELVKKFVESI